ncbi:RING finger family protein [Moumouvirus australiensis]|uniref:RING finger family protein n=1 Tax=Moumouvirus australiensis TaxID=2109587 RepID=A0A2P1EKT1_9VIRU|nr:RING finger family protein [Moumouvirus australiensis]AVL94485.1 RING finger family protein [Moumouvirus australiensis]
MCECNINNLEIFQANIFLAEEQWLLRNNYYFGDYIYIDCDFCPNLKEYPDIRICPTCKKYICHECDKNSILLPSEDDIDISESITYFIRFLIKNNKN